MYPPSQNGHQEVINPYSRRTKPPALSRPFPPGFTPVIVAESPSAQRSTKKSDCSPVFLPPALRSPLPPSDESLTIEKPRTLSNRLAKMSLSPQPSQWNQAKFFPTIRRICNATRPNQRSPSNSVSDRSSPPPAHGRLDSAPQTEPHHSMPTTNRLRSISQQSSMKSTPNLRDLKLSSCSDCSLKKTGESYHNKSNYVSDNSSPPPTRGRVDCSTPHHEPAHSMPPTNRLRSLSQHSSMNSTPKLRGLMPFPLPDCSLETPGESCRNKDILSQAKSMVKPGFPRIRSISTSLSGSPIERAADSTLARPPKEQIQNRSKCNPDFSRARPSTREPPHPCTGRAQIDHTPSYLRFNVDGFYKTQEAGEIELLKKLPDYTLDNWTGWRREILLSACPSPEPSIAHSAS